MNLKYELLIRRAHQVDRYGKPAADADIFDSLGKSYASLQLKPNDRKLLTRYNKEFTKVKGYIITALQKARARAHHGGLAFTAIDACIVQAQAANAFPDLIPVVTNGLDVLVQHNIGW